MKVIENPSRMPLQNLEKAWASNHNLKATQETIKTLLRGGTPNWVRWPREYKAMAQEAVLAHKEQSDTMAYRYKMPHQDELLNEVARKVNAWKTRDFISYLRANGIQCFTIDNGYPPQTVALWALKPGTDYVVPVCYLQVPAMYEWSLLNLDHRGLPNGEAFRGWRTVEVQLIEKGIVSEPEGERLFGKPVDGPVSRRFRESLYLFRNRSGVRQ